MSYHGWETERSVFIQQIEDAISLGYTPITLDEIEKYASRKGKYIHFTSDDGNENDIELAKVLENYNTELTCFINSGSISESTTSLFRNRPNIRLEDHGMYHSAIATSPYFCKIEEKKSPIYGFEKYTITPILNRTGYLASPGFIFNERVFEFLDYVNENKIASFNEFVCEGLDRKVIVKKREDYKFNGHFESYYEFKIRAEQYVIHSKESFYSVFNTNPKYHAYTWWLGNEFANSLFKKHGYLGTFSNAGHSFASGSLWSMPRIYISQKSFKESIDSPYRVEYDFDFKARMKYFAKKHYFAIK